MRKVSSNVRTLLATDNPSSFYLVKIVTTSGTILDTTIPYNVTVPGIGLFSATNGLMAADPPKLSEIVDREVYKLTYADPNFEKIALFETVMTGSEVIVYVGFYNTTGAVFAGVNPGMPILDTADMLIAYAGVVDTHGYSIDAAEGTAIALIECASPMATLGMSKSLLTNPASLKRLNPSDTSFDQVFNKGARLPWGKA